LSNGAAEFSIICRGKLWALHMTKAVGHVQDQGQDSDH